MENARLQGLTMAIEPKDFIKLILICLKGENVQS